VLGNIASLGLKTFKVYEENYILTKSLYG